MTGPSPLDPVIAAIAPFRGRLGRCSPGWSRTSIPGLVAAANAHSRMARFPGARAPGVLIEFLVLADALVVGSFSRNLSGNSDAEHGPIRHCALPPAMSEQTISRCGAT